jgi:hypothetical protein
MKEISDEFMMQMLPQAKLFSVVLLKAGPNYGTPENQPIIWEHARRNFALREEGLLAIVCPVSDETELKGVGIFNADVEQTKEIMEGDPGVIAGVFIYEVHTARSFPGDSLPK